MKFLKKDIEAMLSDKRLLEKFNKEFRFCITKRRIIMKEKKKMVEFDCGVSEVFKAFSKFSLGRFKVSNIDEVNRFIILKKSTSLWSYGEILELKVI